MHSSAEKGANRCIYNLTLVLLNSDMSYLCKQCRSRSVGFWTNWSGSALFAIQDLNLYPQSGWLKISSRRGILIYSACLGLWIALQSVGQWISPLSESSRITKSRVASYTRRKKYHALDTAIFQHDQRTNRATCYLCKVIAKVLPWIPEPNDQRQQEQGSRAKHSRKTCTSERSPSGLCHNF